MYNEGKIMDSKYINVLPILKKHIPISSSYGLKLLEETNGDIDKSILLFKKKSVNIVMSKENIEADIAEKALQKCHFDIGKALNLIREDKYSITERILKRKGKKDNILHRIALVIEENAKLSNDWMIEKECDKLNKKEFTFMIIWDWLQFASWESFDVGIDVIYTDKVIEELKNSLHFEVFANAIEGAKKRKEKYKIHFPYKSVEGYCDFINSLVLDKEYSSHMNIIRTNENLLIENLYDFVSQHKEAFPK